MMGSPAGDTPDGTADIDRMRGRDRGRTITDSPGDPAVLRERDRRPPRATRGFTLN